MNEKRSRAWQWLRRGAAGVLSLILAFSLIQPGLVSAEDTYVCGKEAHAHGDGCYETKTETKTVKVLSCNPPATAAEDGEETAVRWIHTHVAECYDGETLVCALEAAEAHTHGADCYETAEELQCGQDGAEDHEHTEECYQKLTCEQEEIILHTHEDACYLVTAEDGTETKELVCQQAEVAEHVHGDGCYTGQTEDVEVKTLICTLEEHAHDDSCKAQTGNDGETQTADTGLCSICQGEHADADCNYCLLCKADRSQCVICGECGTHAGDHTSLCTEGLCETCQKNPCECSAVCADCGQEPCECAFGEELQEEEDTETYIRPSGFISAAGLVSPSQLSTYGLRRMLLSSTIPGDNSGTTYDADVVTKKDVSVDAAGQYTLTLESYIKAGTDTKNKPVDIVLVLDESGSMRNCYACGTNQCTKHRLGRLAISGTNKGNFQNYDQENGYSGEYLSIGKNTNIKKNNTVYYCWNANEKDGKGYNYRVKWCSTCKNYFQVDAHFTSSGCKPNEGIITTGDTNTVTFYKYDSDGVSGYVSRWEVLNKAVASFLDGVAEDAEKRQVDNRVALISFSNIVQQNTGFKYITSQRSDLDNAIKNLNNLNGTKTNLAMTAANTLLQTVTDSDRNKVVVVFTDGEPTGSGSYFAHSTADAAIKESQTIKEANATVYVIGIFGGADGTNPTTLPNYTQQTEDEDTYYKNNLTARVNATNRFAKLLSSNFTKAAGMLDADREANSGLTGSEQGYFLSPENPAQLIAAFDEIASNLSIRADLAGLNASSVLKDVVTPSFTVENAGDRVITAKSYSYINEGTFATEADDITYEVALNGRTVTATGFDYYANSVGYVEKKVNGETVPEYKGKKLVLTIPIVPNPDFLGGNGVLTNEASESGLYNTYNTLVENFASPILNIAVKEITPVFRTGNIYLGQQAVVPHVANVGHFQYDADGDGEEETSTTTDGINNEYVNIIYTISDVEGKTAFTYTVPAETKHENLNHSADSWTPVPGSQVADIEEFLTPLLKDDTKYKVTVTVVPTDTETVDTLNRNPEVQKAKNAEKDVLVYKPQITFRDSIVDYGQAANYEDATNTEVAKNYISVAWYHGTTEANTTDMGPAPTLTYTYSPAAGVFTKETPVQITAVTPSNASDAGTSSIIYAHTVPEDIEQNLVREVTFYRNDEECTFEPCTSKTKTTVSTAGTTWTNFVVHLNSYDVTIGKKMAEGSDDIQTTYNMEVEITSGHFQTGMVLRYVKEGLSIGSYTVTADDVAAGKVTLNNIPVEAGKPVTIQKVPYDATYTITETSGYGYEASYAYFVTKNDEKETVTTGTAGTAAEGVVTNQEIKIALEIPAITKNLPNPDKETYTFEFALTEVKVEGGKFVDVENSKNNRTATVTLKGQDKEESFTFAALNYETSDLKDGSWITTVTKGGVTENVRQKTFYYRITETTPDSLIVDTDQTEYIMAVTLTGRQGALEAEITSVKQDDNALNGMEEVAFNNTLLGSLTVKKSVVGAEESGSFKFRLTANAAISGNFYAEVNGKETTFTIKDGVADFWLGHKDEITIYGLPHGLEVEIYEYAGDYYPYYKVDSQRTRSGRTVNTEVSSSGTAVKYTNYADEGLLPQTGQLKWPVLALAVLGAGFLGLGVLTRKRKKNGK